MTRISNSSRHLLQWMTSSLVCCQSLLLTIYTSTAQIVQLINSAEMISFCVMLPYNMYFSLLIVGMISKSTGQILHVSGVMHALFNFEGELGSTIAPAATEAATHFVKVCCQQAAYISGRGELEEELKLIVEGYRVPVYQVINWSQIAHKMLVFNVP